MSNHTSFENGDNVTFGKYSVGVYRETKSNGLACVLIGYDYTTNPPQLIIAQVPVEELTLAD